MLECYNDIKNALDYDNTPQEHEYQKQYDYVKSQISSDQNSVNGVLLVNAKGATFANKEDNYIWKDKEEFAKAMADYDKSSDLEQ